AFAMLSLTSRVDVEIYPVLSDGRLDTTRVQQFDIGSNAKAIAISKDDRYIYVGFWDERWPIVVLRRVEGSSGRYEDTGWRIPVGYWVWQMIVSPDGKYLVVNDHHILETFAIQDDGNLVATGYKFPFESVFGNGPMYFQFAYPPAPTEIERQWQVYE
ncbi:MAG: lactonase family protein, partial [bacterium]|nr:lactonase family protein [bacterium]